MGAGRPRGPLRRDRREGLGRECGTHTGATGRDGTGGEGWTVQCPWTHNRLRWRKRVGRYLTGVVEKVRTVCGDAGSRGESGRHGGSVPPDDR